MKKDGKRAKTRTKPKVRPKKVTAVKSKIALNAFDEYAPPPCSGCGSGREVRLVCTGCGNSAPVAEQTAVPVKDENGAVTDHNVTVTPVKLFRRLAVTEVAHPK